MNCLYELQEQLWSDERLFLDIGPLIIRLSTEQHQEQPAAEQALAETANLSAYYRDWSQFDSTTEEDVLNLLADFWMRFNNQDQRAEALTLFELPESASAEDIRRRYRVLAARHHPDKGGDNALFIQVRQAYEVLK